MPGGEDLYSSAPARKWAQARPKSDYGKRVGLPIAAPFLHVRLPTRMTLTCQWDGERKITTGTSHDARLSNSPGYDNGFLYHISRGQPKAVTLGKLMLTIFDRQVNTFKKLQNPEL